MNKSRREKPASRVLYEEGHPTVSCRVTREQYARLEAVRAATGRSFADMLKAGLGVLKENDDKLAEARRQGFQDAYAEADQFLLDAEQVGKQAGYAEAEVKFKVTYPCKVCGQTLEVTSVKEKEAIKQYMQEHGWGHAECINRKQ